MKKNRALQVRDRINSQLRSPILTMATDEKFKVKRIPIGILSLERITGGGFARGRHIELFGQEGSGKSYTAYLTMALAQARGEVCAVIDGEHVFDEEWFRHVGGDPESLIAFHPANAEEAIQTLMLFAQKDDENPGADIVLIDSVSSMLPKEELEKDVMEGDDRIAGQARMMSKLLRRVTTVNQDTVFIWTNQERDKIGGYGGSTTSGGRALRFYASTRIEFRRGEKIKQERMKAKQGKLVKTPTVTGHWVQVRSEKEKTARPHMQGMFAFDSENMRVDDEMDIINLGLEDNLIGRSGNIFSYTDVTGQEHRGLEKKFKSFIREDDLLRAELVEAIKENTKLMATEER